MATIGTIRVVNETPYARTGKVITTVLSVPANTILASNSTFELRAVGARASPVRVQWHDMGINYQGSPAYRRQLRISFDCDCPASSEKTVTIEDTAVAPTAFSLHADVVTSLASQASFQITLGGYHMPAPYPYHTGPGPQGMVTINLPFSSAVLVDEWKDPTNAILKKYRIRARGVGPTAFASLWYGELFIIIGSQKKIADYVLFYGNSLVDSDTSPIYPNPNPLVHLYNNAIDFGAGIMNGGLADADQGVFFRAIGPEVTIMHEWNKVQRQDVLSGPPIVSNVFRLIDPNDYVYNTPQKQRNTKPYEFCDGRQQTIKGALLFQNGTYSAEDTDNHLAERYPVLDTVTPLWATAQDWYANQNYGFLGVVTPRPTNFYINSDADARARSLIVDNYNYAVAQNEVIRSPWGNSYYTNYGNPPVGGVTGSTGDFCWAQKLWPNAVSGSPVMKSADLANHFCASVPCMFRELDVSPLNITNHRANDPSRWTDVCVWQSRPFFGNDQYNPEPALPNGDMLGKKQSIYATGLPNNEWTGRSKEHYAYSTLAYYYNLTGDWQAKILLESVANIVLSEFQHAGLGGMRPTFFSDAPVASRAFARGVQTIYNLYNVLGEHTEEPYASLATRPLELFQHQVQGFVTGFSPDLPVKAWITGNSYSCGNSVGACGRAQQGVGDLITPWQEGMLPIGLYYIYKHTGNATVLDYAKKLARSQQLYTWFNHGSGRTLNGQGVVPGCQGLIQRFASGWLVAKDQLYSGVDFPAGSAIPAGSESDCSYYDPVSQSDLWSLASVVLGYEWAQQGGDAVWAQRCRDILAYWFPNANGRALTTGYGKYPSDNLDEWVGLIRDVFKSRDTGTQDLLVNFTGNSGDLVTIPDIPFRELSTSFDNNTGTMQGTSISIVGSGGGVVYKELRFGFPIPPDDTNHLDLGTGNMSGTVLTKVGATPKELVATFGGNVGSLVATLTNTNLKDLGSVTFATTPSTIAPCVITVLTPVEDIYDVNGSVQSEIPIQVVVGDKVINDHESFRMFAGNTIALLCTVVNTDGTVKDLSDVTAIRWVMMDRADGTILSDRSLNNGISIESLPNGTIRITVPPTATSGKAGEYYHEAKITESTGSLYTIFAGTASVVATHI